MIPVPFWRITPLRVTHCFTVVLRFHYDNNYYEYTFFFILEQKITLQRMTGILEIFHLLKCLLSFQVPFVMQTYDCSCWCIKGGALGYFFENRKIAGFCIFLIEKYLTSTKMLTYHSEYDFFEVSMKFRKVHISWDYNYGKLVAFPYFDQMFSQSPWMVPIKLDILQRFSEIKKKYSPTTWPQIWVRSTIIWENYPDPSHLPLRL